MSTSTFGPYPGLDSNFSRTLRTAGSLLKRYAEARSAAAVAASARPERACVPMGMLTTKWLAAKATGESTSLESLTRGLPKVREGEITAWREATGAARSHRPTMNDIASFRRSNAVSPVGPMYAKFAQNQASESQWAMKHLSPTFRAGSPAETLEHLAHPFAGASTLTQRTRPLRKAAETLDRLTRPFAGASEILNQRTRPFMEAVEVLNRRTQPFREAAETLNRRINDFNGAGETLDRLTRPFVGVPRGLNYQTREFRGAEETLKHLTRDFGAGSYTLPRPGARSYPPRVNPEDPGPAEIEPADTATDTEIMDDLPTVGGFKIRIYSSLQEARCWARGNPVEVQIIVAVAGLVIGIAANVLIAIYL